MDDYGNCLSFHGVCSIEMAKRSGRWWIDGCIYAANGEAIFEENILEFYGVI